MDPDPPSTIALTVGAPGLAKAVWPIPSSVCRRAVAATLAGGAESALARAPRSERAAGRRCHGAQAQRRLPRQGSRDRRPVVSRRSTTCSKQAPRARVARVAPARRHRARRSRPSRPRRRPQARRSPIMSATSWSTAACTSWVTTIRPPMTASAWKGWSAAFSRNSGYPTPTPARPGGRRRQPRASPLRRDDHEGTAGGRARGARLAAPGPARPAARAGQAPQRRWPYLARDARGADRGRRGRRGPGPRRVHRAGAGAAAQRA